MRLAAAIACAAVLATVSYSGTRAAEAQEPAVAMVPLSKLRRAATGWHREQAKTAKLRRAVRAARRRQQEPFTVEDTATAAALLAVIGGWPEAGALRVSYCEAHHQPWARNSTELGGSHASGSWQVLWPGTWQSTSIGRRFSEERYAFNPYVNAAVAWQVWQRNHNTFREWADVCARQG